MKKIGYLVIAVLGNAFGTALMDSSNMGMTAWGSSAKNLAVYLDLSLGYGFLILSIFFYIAAILVRKRFIYIEFIQSFIFLFAFSAFTNYFSSVIPYVGEESILFRLLINIVGLLILLFSIAIHIKIMIAVHPMDVYLKTLQVKFNSVIKGTYFAYASAFLVAILFGLLHGSIVGVGIGTILTLTLSGMILNLYDVLIISKLNI